jgi:hypothetical protein
MNKKFGVFLSKKVLISVNFKLEKIQSILLNFFVGISKFIDVNIPLIRMIYLCLEAGSQIGYVGTKESILL